jgi:uncharacterized protein
VCRAQSKIFKQRGDMFKSILPKEVAFFDFFDKQIALISEACGELLLLSKGEGELVQKVARIKEIEHQADIVTHNCISELHKTFITPLDRFDIHKLMNRLDDIIDLIDGASARFILYNIKEIRPETVEFAKVLIKDADEIDIALKSLRNMKHANITLEKCVEIHKLEHDADVVMQSALCRLLNEETNPITVIKWKEIFELLESATDRCDDVADIIEGLVLEAA